MRYRIGQGVPRVALSAALFAAAFLSWHGDVRAQTAESLPRDTPVRDDAMSGLLLKSSAASIGLSWAIAMQETLGDAPTRRAAVTELLGETEAAVVEAVVPAIDLARSAAQQESIQAPANFMYVRFSKSFLNSYFSRDFEKQLPVKDVILGAQVRGTSQTKARTEIVLLDDPDNAKARLLFRGATHFDTTSYSGPIQVRSRGVTRFAAAKEVSFNGLQVLQSPPATNVATSTRTVGISSSLPGLRGRISTRIASREVAERRGLAQQITGQRTKKRIEGAFDRIAQERADMFSKELQTQYANLPFEGQFALADIQCRTTSDMLQIKLVGRGENEPIFAEDPPRLPNQPDIEIHIHSALLQKLIVNAELRQTLQAAAVAVIERPLLGDRPAKPSIDAVADGDAGEADAVPAETSDDGVQRELHFQWTEAGDLPWLTLAWYKQSAEERSAAGHPSRRVAAPPPAPRQ